MAKVRNLRTADYKSLQFTAGAALSAKDMDKIQDLVGFYFAEAAVGEEVAFVYEMHDVELPKVGNQIARGQHLFYVNATDNVSNTDGGGSNEYCGFAKADAAAGDAYVRAALIGAGGPH